VYALSVNTQAAVTKTHWPTIWLLFFAGCTVSTHVGKLPAALPLLVSEFDLSLSQSGSLVSTYAVLIAVAAFVIGLFVSRYGYVVAALLGVSMAAAGSVAGVFSESVGLLMVTRAMEGMGWILAVASFPGLMSAMSVSRDRPVVLGIWGAFMPVGGGVMLIVAPTLQSFGGWRFSWLVTAAISVLGCIAVLSVTYRMRSQFAQESSGKIQLRLSDYFQRPAIALWLCFFLYSFTFVTVIAYLPIALIEESGLSLDTAARWTGLIMLCNAIGNMSSGRMIRYGLKRHHILAFAGIGMGICAFVALSGISMAITIVAAALMTGISGIIPGTLFGTAPLVSSGISGVGAMLGFMLTGCGVGMFLGPITLTSVVEITGLWMTGGFLLLAVGILCAASAQLFKDLSLAPMSN